MKINLEEIDFSTLDPKEIGSWPIILRVVVAMVAGIATVIITYIFYLSGQIELLDKQHLDQENKKIEFKTQYNMAINLESYQKQMDGLTLSYKDQLKQMPPVGNIPELISEVTRQAEKNGLKINSIKLGEPQNKSEFYQDMDLDLSISGNYHGMGKFLAGLSKLQRLVTLHNFVLTPEKGKGSTDLGLLHLGIKVKAYWLDFKEDKKEDEENGVVDTEMGGAKAKQDVRKRPGQ